MKLFKKLAAGRQTGENQGNESINFYLFFQSTEINCRRHAHLQFLSVYTTNFFIKLMAQNGDLERAS